MPLHREPTPGPTAMDMICQFNKLKPPKFQERADPLGYKELIRRLEKLFEIMNCPARFNVALATYQFKGEAEYWWEMVKLRGDEPLITWERLKILMDTKYCLRDAKSCEGARVFKLKARKYKRNGICDEV